MGKPVLLMAQIWKSPNSQKQLLTQTLAERFWVSRHCLVLAGDHAVPIRLFFSFFFQFSSLLLFLPFCSFTILPVPTLSLSDSFPHMLYSPTGLPRAEAWSQGICLGGPFLSFFLSLIHTPPYCQQHLPYLPPITASWQGRSCWTLGNIEILITLLSTPLPYWDWYFNSCPIFTLHSP